jgi:hypothetical protein
VVWSLLTGAALSLALFCVMVFSGCGHIQGNVAPLHDFGDIARDPEAYVGSRVRTFAVIDGWSAGLIDLGQGLTPSYAIAQAYRADAFGTALCDPSQRSGARFSVMVSDAAAAQLKRYRPDTVYALVGTMRRREGAGGYSPTPVWLEVEQAVPMRTCQRPFIP